MNTSADLQNKTVAFLNTNAHLQRENERRAVARLAGLDDDLIGHIEFTGSTLAFLPAFIETLVTYGTLSDGRNALEAFLKAVEQIVGEGEKETIEGFIRQWRALPTKAELKPHNIDRYLRYVIDTWKNIESPLLPPDISLARIAAHLKMSDVKNSPDYSKKPKLPGYRKKSLIDSHLSGTELGEYLENNPAVERWVILGDPGTGKTTLSLFEAYRLAQIALNDSQKKVPAWISLATFNAQLEKNFDWSIYDYISAIGHSLALTNLGKQFSELATEGRVTFLFDGLDEVADRARKSLCDRIYI
jgi:Effector-associated domain 8